MEITSRPDTIDIEEAVNQYPIMQKTQVRVPGRGEVLGEWYEEKKTAVE